MAGKRQNNKRKYPDGTGSRPDNSKHKREEAIERQAGYESLTTAQKIAMLDTKLGAGLGAKKQRALLAKTADTVARVNKEHGVEEKAKE